MRVIIWGGAYCSLLKVFKHLVGQRKQKDIFSHLFFIHFRNAASHVGRNSYINLFGVRQIEIFHNFYKLLLGFGPSKSWIVFLLVLNGGFGTTFVVVSRVDHGSIRKSKQLVVHRVIQILSRTTLKVSSTTTYN